MSGRKYAIERETQRMMAEHKRLRDHLMYFCDSEGCPGLSYDSVVTPHPESRCGGTEGARARRRND